MAVRGFSSIAKEEGGKWWKKQEWEVQLIAKSDSSENERQKHEMGSAGLVQSPALETLDAESQKSCHKSRP
jgi:hypothetical protein